LFVSKKNRSRTHQANLSVTGRLIESAACDLVWSLRLLGNSQRDGRRLSSSLGGLAQFFCFVFVLLVFGDKVLSL
jgi:hypothetical protein